jgi:carbamoyltransferase
MNILGISCFYHDSAACLVKHGKIVAAGHEERFSRVKHDNAFPLGVVNYCLQEGQIDVSDIDAVVFYEKPFLKFERIIKNQMLSWPRGAMHFPTLLNSWLGLKINMSTVIKKRIGYTGPIYFTKHHEAHAASTYYCSPFNKAAIVTLDGVGEWATSSIAIGEGNTISTLQEIHYPDSLGLFYSGFTYYLGFKVNDGEYKVMGLAPYGNPKYKDKIFGNIIELHSDGSFTLNLDYFSFMHGDKTINEGSFERLFNIPVRTKKDQLTQTHKDFAASVQCVLEDIVQQMVKNAVSMTGEKKVCLAGGVALNCVSNSKLLLNGIADEMFVFPSPGDSGGAIGAALYTWHYLANPPEKSEAIRDIYWGPEYGDKEISSFLKRLNLEYEYLNDDVIFNRVARMIADQKIIGWFQGRMEFGPRALGNRSILADSRNKENWMKVNQKIKFRESFRPFAPSIMEEYYSDYFEFPTTSPYMLYTAQTKTDNIPAVTHVDKSARIQTVSEKDNPRFYKLLKAFNELTGVPVLINTSFNLADDPIVCTPQDAYRCFLISEMDVLVLGSYLVTQKINR